mmetsp:Transcript_6657/g.19175  ORF Transcript_6657/g.19175 Transcript_6657/m.19175 type:complete len:247 (-) Transcript_6657:678-1418(-)
MVLLEMKGLRDFRNGRQVIGKVDVDVDVVDVVELTGHRDSIRDSVLLGRQLHLARVFLAEAPDVDAQVRGGLGGRVQDVYAAPLAKGVGTLVAGRVVEDVVGSEVLVAGVDPKVFGLHLRVPKLDLSGPVLCRQDAGCQHGKLDRFAVAGTLVGDKRPLCWLLAVPCFFGCGRGGTSNKLGLLEQYSAHGSTDETENGIARRSSLFFFGHHVFRNQVVVVVVVVVFGEDGFGAVADFVLDFPVPSQ